MSLDHLVAGFTPCFEFAFFFLMNVHEKCKSVGIRFDRVALDIIPTSESIVTLSESLKRGGFAENSVRVPFNLILFFFQLYSAETKKYQCNLFTEVVEQAAFQG